MCRPRTRLSGVDRQFLFHAGRRLEVAPACRGQAAARGCSGHRRRRRAIRARRLAGHGAFVPLRSAGEGFSPSSVKPLMNSWLRRADEPLSVVMFVVDPADPSICSSLGWVGFQLRGRLHRRIHGDRLDEAADDHRHGLVSRMRCGHQGGQAVSLTRGPSPRRPMVALVLADLDVRVGLRPADGVHQEGVTSGPCWPVAWRLRGSTKARGRPHGHRRGPRTWNDRASCVGAMSTIFNRVLVLAFFTGNTMDRSRPSRLRPPGRRRLHRDLRGPMLPSIHSHRRALFADGALGDQVCHVGGPVLDGRVATPAPFFTIISTTAECSRSRCRSARCSLRCSGRRSPRPR